MGKVFYRNDEENIDDCWIGNTARRARSRRGGPSSTVRSSGDRPPRPNPRRTPLEEKAGKKKPKETTDLATKGRPSPYATDLPPVLEKKAHGRVSLVTQAPRRKV